MDTVSKEKRSEIMSKIHSPTKLEGAVHDWLVSEGIEHEMYPRAEGRPDILLPNRGDPLYVFVDGCFWHCCPLHYRRPRTRKKFWIPHIEESNTEREKRRAKLPYRWVRVWEHEVKDGAFRGIILKAVKRNRRAEWASALKRVVFGAFSFLAKPLLGTGIAKFPPLGLLYRWLFRSLVPSGERLVRIHGYKMMVTPSYSNVGLLLGGGYENYETVVFKRLVKRGMTVVDVGANIGYYTLLASKLVGEKGRVYAFEPEPRNYAMLKRNIEINNLKNVTPVEKAVFSEVPSGRIILTLSRNSAEHGVYFPSGDAKTVAVGAVSLDGFFGGKRCPDVVKVDVEGAEVSVLMGMARTIKRNKNLVLFTEFYPPFLERAGTSAREYWDILRMMGGFDYIYLINEKRRRLEEVNFSSMMRFCGGGVFGTPAVANLLCSKSPLRECSEWA